MLYIYTMNTIELLKAHAAAIIANGGPKTKSEFSIMKIHSSLFVKPVRHFSKAKKQRTKKASA